MKIVTWKTALEATPEGRGVYAFLAPTGYGLGQRFSAAYIGMSMDFPVRHGRMIGGHPDWCEALVRYGCTGIGFWPLLPGTPEAAIRQLEQDLIELHQPPMNESGPLLGKAERERMWNDRHYALWRPTFTLHDYPSLPGWAA